MVFRTLKERGAGEYTGPSCLGCELWQKQLFRTTYPDMCLAFDLEFELRVFSPHPRNSPNCANLHHRKYTPTKRNTHKTNTTPLDIASTILPA